ncbi:hypothetical protein AAHZ94_23875 [Streptomyces sp. HSW2009]|uniref:hypothetical protein n=1 Tax=Streptomyces sp. HSW2009 TaxID=3142890 RepID=UPI0032ED5069
MVGIESGMTPQQVVAVLGPPLDFLDMLALVGPASPAGQPGAAADSRLRDRCWWLYRDVPRPGVEVNVNFRGGRVVEARVRPYDRSAYSVFRHDWARVPMLDEIAAVERALPDGRLTGRPGWRVLADGPALEFALSSYAYPAEPDDVGRAARRFGPVDVVVSLFDVAEPERIRAVMRDGYVAELHALADKLGLLPRRLDLAHWVIGRSPDGGATAHLSFLPVDATIAPHYPSALLGPGEGAGRGAG